ncbi:MAG: thioredoxin family protein [Ignavibacteriales bacterium]|nr:thioredoxin family protein [Ignavibacteriales bacterium]
MKIFNLPLVVFLLVFTSMNNVFSQSFDKTTSFDSLLNKSLTEKKTILLLFGSRSCMPCELLYKAFLRDTTLMRKLNDKYILRYVESHIMDINHKLIYENNENGKIAKRFVKNGLPVIIILEVTSEKKYIVKQKILGVALKKDEPELKNPAVIMKDNGTVDIESTMKYIPL